MVRNVRKKMHIFHPNEGQTQEGFNTSFTFDNADEEHAFMGWLSDVQIQFVRSKVPVIQDGVMTQQTCLVINRQQTHEDDSSKYQLVSSPVVEVSSVEEVEPTTTVSVEVDAVKETEPAPALPEQPKKRKKSKKHRS